jgi:hypothetical protein
MTVANQYLLKAEFLKAAQMLLEAFSILTYSEDGVADLVGHSSRRFCIHDFGRRSSTIRTVWFGQLSVLLLPFLVAPLGQHDANGRCHLGIALWCK